MRSKFFDIVNDFNLSTYYLLPLLGLGKLSFGAPQNFVDCYVTPTGEYLVVKLRMMAPFLYHHPEYIRDSMTPDNCVDVVFRIPDEFANDVAHFMTGKYSQFSHRTKELIRAYSCLLYRMPHPTTGKSTTDARLMALEDDEEQRLILRRKLEHELDIVLSEEAELMSKPSDRNYIELTQVDTLPTA